jgi:hypothetical protein
MLKPIIRNPVQAPIAAEPSHRIAGTFSPPSNALSQTTCGTTSDFRVANPLRAADRQVKDPFIAGVPAALAESAQTVHEHVRRCGVKKPDNRRCRLLRARRERPSRRRAANQRDELAPSHRYAHSIISSASCWRCKGTSRPIALAALRLMTSSNFVGACTGSSAGFSPLRMRSTYVAARRKLSIWSTP